MNTRKPSFPFYAAVLVACVLAPGIGRSAESDSGKERELIGVLKSSAPPEEKAVACKRLAVYGSAEAVPVLAPLLADEHLASWARIPLEVIPGAAADDALRQAMGRLNGKLLVGTINSIGVRRDTKAIDGLAAKLKDADADVVAAAAVALGRIGEDRSAKILRGFVNKAPEAVRGAVAEGCIRCAEGLFAADKAGAAVTLYDTVRDAKVPRQKVLEATRGAILARQSKGITLLLTQLKSPDKEFFGIGLRTARELPGNEVTPALAKQLWAATSDRQPLILLAIADRGDAMAMATVLECARSSGKPLQLAALKVLDRKGDVSSIPVLLEAAAGEDPDLAQAGSAALTRLYGPEVEAALLKRLTDATGKKRQVLLEVTGRRGMAGCLPAALASAADPDAGIRTAALQAIGGLGGTKQIPELLRLLHQAPGPKFREEIEKALLGISGRTGASCSSSLQSLAEDRDSGLRIIALHVLAAAGGPEALTVVNAGINDKDEAVRDEAVRTLSSWPSTWPEDGSVAEPLLALAKAGKKTSHQVLAARGYLRFLEVDKKLSETEKAEKLNGVVPLLARPEEKRSAIAVAQHIRAPGVLKVLTGFAQDPGLAEEASSAIVENASKEAPGVSKEERQQALQAAIEKTPNAGTKQKAEAALKKLQ